MWKRGRRRYGAPRARIAVVGLCLAALAGCSLQSDDKPSTSPDPAFVTMMQEWQTQAVSSDATEEQRELIARAIAQGDISFEDLEDATAATFACFESASIGYTSEVDDTTPLPLITYNYSSAASGNPVAEDCIVKNSYFVEAGYQNQPRWFSVINERITANRDEIVACLQDLDIEISSEATADEIRQATKLSNEELFAYLDAGSRVPIDCLVDFNAN